MIRRLLLKAPLLLWFLPGFLLWASFPPMGERLDIFFALAPLLWYARSRTPRRNFFVWFVNGFFFWFVTLSWMPAIIKNGGPWPLVVLGWGVLSAYCALYFGAFGWLSSRVWGWVRGRSYGWRLFALVVVEPILWAGLEVIRSRFGGGFAWNQLGVAPINAGLGAPAALGGVYLVSLVVVLVNGTIASIAERMLAPYQERIDDFYAPRRKGPDLTGASAEASDESVKEAASYPRWARSVETLIPFLLIFGIYQLARPYAVQETDDRETVSVSFGLMQRNFPAVFKGPEDARPVYTKMIGELMRTRPDVLVLPESAFCEVGAVDDVRAERFVETWLGRVRPAAVLAGGSRTDGEARQFNSFAAYVLADGTNVVGRQIYDKVHLVPFGEFIPGDKLIPALQRLAPVGSCTPGEVKVLEVPVDDAVIRVAPAICYEDTDSAQIREQAAMGAQVLVFVTNDNWFALSIEPEQHAWQAVARAVETGLPVVRAANSGVTGFVLPDGRATWLRGTDGLPLVDESGTLTARIPLPVKPQPTPYVRLGDAPLFCAFLLLLAALSPVLFPKVRNRLGFAILKS